MVFKMKDSVNITSGTNNNNGVSEKKLKIWKQLLLSVIASLPFLTHGVETTALSSSAHSGHFIASSDDVPWSATALIIAAAASAPIYCFLIEKYGRKIGIFGVSLMQGASCIPLFLPQSEASNIVLHVFAGLSAGGLFTVLPIYIREISSDSIRGVTVSMMMLMTTIGYLTYLVMDLEGMMFLLLALIAAQFLGMMVMIESPSYLVMKGNIEVAKTSWAKLRCSSVDNSQVIKEVNSLKNESDRAKLNGKLTLWRILKNPIYRDVTKIGFMLNTIMILSGSIAFLDQDKTLAQLRMATEFEKTMILGCLFGGSLLTFAVIRILDRKTILSFSYSIMMFAMGWLSIFTQANLTVTSLRWLPVLALGVIVFGYGMGWGMPTVIMVESLNMEIRSMIICFLYVYSQLLKLAHVHTFKYLEEYMGLYTLFFIFSCINMLGGVYVLFIAPTIKGKTVRQIERQLKRVPLINFDTIKA